jgi:hypothetical protein
MVPGTVSSVPAQDPLPIYRQNYRVMVENDREWVLDFRLRKGHAALKREAPPGDNLQAGR